MHILCAKCELPWLRNGRQDNELHEVATEYGPKNSEEELVGNHCFISILIQAVTFYHEEDMIKLKNSSLHKMFLF